MAGFRLTNMLRSTLSAIFATFEIDVALVDNASYHISYTEVHSFWPWLGLPSKGQSSHAKNQLLQNHLRKRTSKSAKYRLPLHHRKIHITHSLTRSFIHSFLSLFVYCFPLYLIVNYFAMPIFKKHATAILS